jgi:hypothetical protein
LPFSLDERVKQCYTHNVGKVASDWEELKNRFFLTFFPISRIVVLQQEILSFEQKEKESISAAWDKFLILMRSGPDLSIPNHVLLQHFWIGFRKESSLHLDIAVRGLFTHKTTVEGETLLDHILENTPPLETIRVEPELNHYAEAEPITSLERPSPKPEDPKESFQPSDLPYFEYEFFEDFGNTSKYSCQKRPPIPVTP